MATFSITTTTEQDAALTTLRRALNQERNVPLTAKEYRDYIVSQWLDGLVTQAKTYGETGIREAWQKADEEIRTKVRTILGVT
jgi:hypothetical protein